MLICSICVYTFSANGDLNHDTVVCSPSLKVSAFTTAVIDNIDYNQSSNTATSSFHGTVILLFQHPSLGKGDEREAPDFQIKQKKLQKLPSYYTDIKPATFNMTITVQEPNAFNDTPNNIPSTKTSSNDRQEEENVWICS